ncbi:hypothetical protein [Parasitella parasitica]|uniref:Transcription initiation factor TFIID subunit 8 n=1 Tax=Parasitella parasitica TaxID=35722 RepID=A0A0B7NVT1_9FUNG|nr:hypothetical protein [Parasitella parasitica]
MQNKRGYSDNFTFEVNEKVISIVAKEIGFQGVQAQALEVFSNLLDSYMDKMLSSAHLFAELGNRAKPNIHDITRSLENAGIEISNFKDYLRTRLNDTKTEFIPDFLPSDNEDSEDEAEDHTTEGGMPTYVPRHLPLFPSKHSFRQTPIYINRPDDPQKVRELTSEQSRTVEENLKKLMSAENQLLRQGNVESASALLESSTTTTTSSSSSSSSSSIMIPIVNYEGFIQRRKRQKQSGTTLNVEGSDEPKPNNSSTTNNASDMGGMDLDTTQPGEEEEESQAA